MTKYYPNQVDDNTDDNILRWTTPTLADPHHAPAVSTSSKVRLLETFVVLAKVLLHLPKERLEQIVGFLIFAATFICEQEL